MSVWRAISVPWSQVIERSRDGGIAHPPGEGVMQGERVVTGKVQQPDQPGSALHEGADRRPVVAADDQISFPVPGRGSVTGIERALMDGQHRLGEPRPAPLDPLVGSPMITPGPQRGTMFRRDLPWPDECGSGQVDRLVDALVTHPHAGLVRVLGP
jgi:hypothetical protein